MTQVSTSVVRELGMIMSFKCKMVDKADLLQHFRSAGVGPFQQTEVPMG